MSDFCGFASKVDFCAFCYNSAVSNYEEAEKRGFPTATCLCVGGGSKQVGGKEELLACIDHWEKSLADAQHEAEVFERHRGQAIPVGGWDD